MGGDEGVAGHLEGLVRFVGGALGLAGRAPGVDGGDAGGAKCARHPDRLPEADPGLVVAGARRLLHSVGRAISLIQAFPALLFLVLGLGAALPIGPVRRQIGKAVRAAAFAARLVAAVGRTLEATGRHFRTRRRKHQNSRQHSPQTS